MKETMDSALLGRETRFLLREWDRLRTPPSHHKQKVSRQGAREREDPALAAKHRKGGPDLGIMVAIDDKHVGHAGSPPGFSD